MDDKQHLALFWGNPVLWNQYGLDKTYVDRIATVKEMIPHGIESILDVGVGKGEIVNDIYQSYKRVVAIDISVEALTYVQCPAKVARLEAMPFESHSFDLVMCLEVLEHLQSPSFEAGISELQRVASEYLLIGVPYNENLDLRKTRCPSCGKSFNADTHVRTFESVNALTCCFPQFRLVSHNSGGGLYRRASRLETAIRGVCLQWEAWFVCVHCGFTDARPHRQTRSIIGKFRSQIGIALSHCGRMQPYWLIVLLQRNREL